MNNRVINDLMKRRTIYALGRNVHQDPAEIAEVIKAAIKHSPTAFNTQTVRVVILFGQSSEEVWDIVEERLKSEVANEKGFKKTQAKIASFREGFGTVLFFTDTDVVKQLEKSFPLYADNFADWAEQGIGGAQQAVWVALAQEGIGASLQHYNPLIDELIASEFDLPSNWKLRAQMPFGSIEAPASSKDFIGDEERFKVRFD